MKGPTNGEPDAARADVAAASARSARSSTLPRRILAAAGLVARAGPWTLALHVGLTLLAATIPVAVAWFTKALIDRLVEGSGTGSLIALASALAATGLLASVAPQVTQYFRTEMERAVGLTAQDRLLTAVGRFVGLGRFENPHFLDRLRLAQQPGGMSPHPSKAIDGALGVGRAALTTAGFLGSLLLISPVMTCLVLLSGIPSLVAQISLSRRRARMYWEIGPAERREFFYSGLLSTVKAAKEVRLFGTGDFLRERALSNRRAANSAKRVMDRRQMVVQVGLGTLTGLVAGGGLLWAVAAARQGRISIGDVTMFIAAVSGVRGALASLATDIAQTHHSLLMFDHYIAVTRAGPDLPVAERPRPVPPLRSGIELRDVWFRYSDDHPWVLRGVDLHIPNGKATALVGANGAGKSTMVKLLCRFYDPGRGAILWDGVDIREIDAAELRRRIGAVFQDYMEYDMSAAENIGLGDLAAMGDQDRIQRAAELAGVHDKLSGLPDGYDTLLSRLFFTEEDKENPDTGVVLSGGQWQRLALARAFLRAKRDLMILDEPSAGLDAEAEHRIHSSLRRLRAGRTSLLISHRLGTVRDADQIVVLGDGRVVEQGDHAGLVAGGGEYARLFALQAAGYQPEPEGTAAAAGRAP